MARSEGTLVHMDIPAWPLREDSEQRWYAYAYNALLVAPRRGKKNTKWVQIPAEFFSYMESITTDAQRKKLKLNGGGFALREQENGAWCLLFEAFPAPSPRAATPERWALWMYSAGKAPGWLVD